MKYKLFVNVFTVTFIEFNALFINKSIDKSSNLSGEKPDPLDFSMLV